MELHVNQAMFAGMRRAAAEADLYGQDSAIAAWEFTGIKPIPCFKDVAVKVCLPDYGTGSAKLVEAPPL